MAAFGARAQGPAPHDPYLPPPESEGGWRTLVDPNTAPSVAQAGRVREICGLDWLRLEEAWRYCLQFEGDNRLLVVRHGWVAGEWFTAEGPRGVASCTKSLTALAVAKLADLGKIGLDDPAYRYLPGRWRRRDRRRRNIEIRHLLTMSSGLDPYDGPYRDLDAYAKTVVSRRVEAPPGKVWAYSSTAVDLLSLIVERAAKRKLGDFFNAEIGAPIGLEAIEWPEFRGHSGASGGPHGGARLDARGLARVGRLMLHGGLWDGRRVLSEERVRQFTSWAPFLDGATFRAPNFWVTQPGSQNYYGYLWWTNRTGEALGETVPRDAYFMSGFAMKTCIVVPSLDMVVVRLGSDREANEHPEFYREMMARVMGAVAVD